jgi:hypothetical protein
MHYPESLNERGFYTSEDLKWDAPLGASFQIVTDI